MSEDTTFTELITQHIDYSMKDKYTTIPGIILAIKEEGKRLLLDVQPLVSLLLRDGQVVAQSTILNVPMQQPASSRGGMVFPVAVGDNVLLAFSMRGIDTWKYGNGTPQAPMDYRMFDKKDCIAIPCIFPTSKSIADPAKHNSSYESGDVSIFNSLGSSHVEIVLKANGDVVVNSPGKVTVNCADSEVNASSSVKYNTGQFEINSSSFRVNTGTYSVAATSTATTTGTFSMNGSWVLNGIAIETHRHTGVESGGDTSGGPV